MSGDGKAGPAGNGITEITLLSTIGKTKKYRIKFTNGTYYDYEVVDGTDGTGDMNKSVYDADNDGIVDNAKKVNGHTVQSDVPANAEFTDTVYDDTAIKNDITSLQNNKADKNTIPTKVSQLSNDKNFLSTETDPTVPSHVKSITQANITSWNDKYTKTEINNMIGDVESILRRLTTGSGV